MRTSFLTIFAFLLCSHLSADNMRIVNDYGERITLFQYCSVDWDKPPYTLAQRSKALVDLARSGKYYFTLFDRNNRERKIGWIDLHPIYDRDPKAEVGINQLFFCEQSAQAEPYWDAKLHKWVTRTVCKAIRKPTGEPVFYIYSGGKTYQADDFVKRFQPKR